MESKLFIPERNQLIVDTYLKYVNGKRTVIFCASVDHAAEIAKLLRDNGVNAEAVSGRDRVEIREKVLKDYETGVNGRIVRLRFAERRLGQPAYHRSVYGTANDVQNYLYAAAWSWYAPLSGKG